MACDETRRVSIKGRWRILEMELWDQDAIDLLAVVQATLDATARSQELTVGAAILTGGKSESHRCAGGRMTKTASACRSHQAQPSDDREHLRRWQPADEEAGPRQLRLSSSSPSCRSRSIAIERDCYESSGVSQPSPPARPTRRADR